MIAQKQWIGMSAEEFRLPGGSPKREMIKAKPT